MNQYSIAIFLLLSLTLTSCTTKTMYGNFVKKPTEINQQTIAADAVNKILELYPPAKTRFVLKQPTPDVFGNTLVSQLRKQGYALLEFHPKTSHSTTADTEAYLQLSYIVDQFIGTNMYRVTIHIGNQSITRPYHQKNGNSIPTGYWVRKE